MMRLIRDQADMRNLPGDDAAAPPDRQRLGTLIHEARERRGLSRRQLAQRLNVSIFAVSRWERGASAPHPRLTEGIVTELRLPEAEASELRELQAAEWSTSTE